MTARDEFAIGNEQFISDKALAGLKPKKRDFVRMKHRDIAGVVTTRKFYPTVSKARCLLVDVITGTLYDAMSGRCLSSSQNRLVVATAGQVATAKPKRVRKTTAAREADGWMSDKRRVA